MRDFYVLFIEELRKMRSAEQQIAKALPYMIQASCSSKLKAALKEHLVDALKQIQRLEEIAADFDEDITKGDNPAIKYLLQEGKKVIQHWHQDRATRDAAIVMHMQKVQHYELALYGNLKAFAKHFKLEHAREILEESSREEGYMNKKLTEIAEGTFFDTGVNAKARRKCA